MNLLIGIDPDCDKSGVAFLESGELNLFNLTFPQLMRSLEENKEFLKMVIIEAGWLNKSVWHLPQSLSRMSASQAHKVGAETGRRVGRNHATGTLIAEMCESMGLPYLLVKPTRTKLNAEEFKLLTGYEGRTNQETRDAGVLAFSKK
jgi:hypothetical protein